jgi:hypothetical protein
MVGEKATRCRRGRPTASHPAEVVVVRDSSLPCRRLEDPYVRGDGARDDIGGGIRRGCAGEQQVEGVMVRTQSMMTALYSRGLQESRMKSSPTPVGPHEGLRPRCARLRAHRGAAAATKS